MFKNEINQDRVNVIITKIDAAIRKKQERERSSRNIVLGDVVH
jgi:transcriptional regulator NrdR family protein